jgi:3-phenylpropionate/trans-cinnamate dioxygenase ferredoxin reductase subunit
MDVDVNSPDVERVVIAGAGLSGLRTAEKLRRAGYGGRLTMLGAEHHLPYDRPPLSKKLLVQPETPADPVLLRQRERWEALELEVVLSCEVTGLDLPSRSVTAADGRTWAWDRLVIATGVRPRTAPDWGAHGVYLLRTFDDCLRLRTALHSASRVTVIGGGVLGCEVAASARALGLEVHLVEPLATPLFRAIGPRLGSYVAGLHQRRGVRLHTGVGVDAIANDGGTRVTLEDGTVLEADVVFAAIGSIPNVEWLAESGLALGDGVLCDATGTTSSPDVLAVGDVAHMPHGPAGASRLEHWTSAAETASLVAANLLVRHSERRALTEVPYFWTDQYDVKLQTLGVPTPQDEVTVVDGALDDEGGFLVLHSRGDTVTGVSAVGRAAMLNRCRPLVAAPASLHATMDARPWSQIV